MTAAIILLLASWGWYFARIRPRHREAIRQRETRIRELQGQVEALDAALQQNASGEAWAQAVREALGLA